jgi:hypothetical protein
MATQDEPVTIVLQNEFATVRLVIDGLANGPRLLIIDPASGRHIALDPLELQSLAWSRHEHLEEFMRPAFKEQYLDRIKGGADSATDSTPEEH